MEDYASLLAVNIFYPRGEENFVVLRPKFFKNILCNQEQPVCERP